MTKARKESAAYTTPRLKVFGSVRNLTGGSVADGQGDGQLGMSMSMIML